jgi:hypothetical protein
MPSGALSPSRTDGHFILADDFKRQSLGKQAPSQSLPQTVLPIVDHACDFRSPRSAKIEKHLSAQLGVKNRFARR